jgi:hypothetical protein
MHETMMDRTFVLDNDLRAEAAARFIASNWRQMMAAGHAMALRCYEFKEVRTREQQSLMWIRVGEIAAQAWVGGRQYSEEVWHEQLKREYLPDEVGPTKRCRKGYVKWAVMPSGDRALIGSTTQLTTFGMSEYMDQVMAYGAGELGVRFAPTPAEAAQFHRERSA